MCELGLTSAAVVAGGSPSRVSLTVLLERCTVCDPAFGLSALRIIVIMSTASHNAVCQPDGLYSVFVSPTSLRPLSCPALGPRVIDRPRDSGFGGCCAASLLLLQRNRVAPLRSAHHRELSPRLALILCLQKRDIKSVTFRALYRPPAGRLYFPRESFFFSNPPWGDI